MVAISLKTGIAGELLVQFRDMSMDDWSLFSQSQVDSPFDFVQSTSTDIQIGYSWNGYINSVEITMHGGSQSLDVQTAIGIKP